MLGIFRKKGENAQNAMLEHLKDFHLQSFPVLIMEALSDLRNPDMSLGAVASKLEGDPGMSVKILRTVNSAAFGLSREVTSLHGAISMMGHARLETILLTHAVKGSLPAVRTPNFNMKQFWAASAQRACLARSIALRLHPASQVEAFTAGLLLDMAVPVLVKHQADAYTEMFAAIEGRQHWLHECELERFSFDHTDAGGHMAREWKLPQYLTDAIACHHHDDKDAPVAPGVRIASMIRHNADAASLEPAYELAGNDYGLGRDTMQLIVADAFAEAEEFAKKIS